MNRDSISTRITGNAPPDVKAVFANIHVFTEKWGSGNGPFGYSMAEAIYITEVSIIKNPEEPAREEARVVSEITVDDAMLNGIGTLHGACSAFLIDLCSTFPLLALNLAKSGKPLPNVSQSLNLVLHSPAVVGDKLRIVATSLTMGTRTLSSRAEVWNATQHRLVSSGVHIKMQASTPKANL